MSGRPPQTRGRLSLAALAALALVGLGLLLRLEARGGPAWPFGLHLALSAALLVASWRWVVVPSSRLSRRLAAAEAESAARETGLLAGLDHLRAGDLVHGAGAAAQLPPAAAAALREALHGLEPLAQRIQSSSIEVAGAAGAVNQVAAELASGSSQQSASVVEITAAMEELARSAAQIAESAAAQADLAQRAAAAGDSGRAAVADAVAGVEEMRKRIRGIAERAEILDRRSREIFRVLDLITEIAQETHILSLNAAIEAAAAGGHGQRFATVADEVRRLAQRSQESVESVRRLVGDFTASIRATVVATDQGTGAADRVRQRAQAAAAAIGELQAAAAETAHSAREISAATQQQNTAANEVVLTLREASLVVQRMAEGLNRFLDAAHRLNQLGLSTQLLAQTFHLDSQHSLKHRAERWAAEVRRCLVSWEAVERRLQEWVEGDPYVECAYYLEADGGRLALAANRQLLGDRPVPPAVREGEGFTERPWYRLAVRAGRSVVTPAFTSLLSAQSIVTAAAPLYAEGENGRVLVGVLGLDVNVDQWTHR